MNSLATSGIASMRGMSFPGSVSCSNIAAPRFEGAIRRHAAERLAKRSSYSLLSKLLTIR